MAKTLKNVSEALKISEGWLKGLVKGQGKTKDTIVTHNTANACRAVAQFTGYKSVESAKKAITNNVKMLYESSANLARRIEKVIPKYGKVKQEILTQAVSALRNNNFTEYNRLIRSNKELVKGYKRKCAKNINQKLIEQLRCSASTNRQTAISILKGAGVKYGSKIVVPQEKIDKEIEKRLKRYGSVGSLFWQAAKQLNPKIKPQKLQKEKRKKHKATKGAGYKTTITSDAAVATVVHNAEINQKFKKKLLKRIAQQEKWWAKQAEKQIIAAKFFDKLLDKI